MSAFSHGLVLKVWHPSVGSAEIERAVGAKASISYSVGDPRGAGDGAPHRETYCLFSIVEKATTDPLDSLRFAAPLAVSLHSNAPNFIESGGELVLSYEVFDASFSSLYLPAQVVADLASWGAGLAVVEMRGTP